MVSVDFKYALFKSQYTRLVKNILSLNGRIKHINLLECQMGILIPCGYL